MDVTIHTHLCISGGRRARNNRVRFVQMTLAVIAHSVKRARRRRQVRAASFSFEGVCARIGYNECVDVTN